MNNIYMIYMAAGNSRRFSKNENKLLYKLNDIPMYQYGLRHLAALERERCDCDLLIVTQHKEIEEYAKKNGIAVLWNLDSKMGASYTIKAGINYFIQNRSDYNEDTDYFMFMVADQPYITKETIKALLEEAKNHPETASIAYKDKVGNPTLISAKYATELMKLTGDQGGRKVIRNHSCTFVPAKMEEELQDIDERP